MYEPQQVSVLHFFGEMDKDHDGKLSRKEFICGGFI